MEYKKDDFLAGKDKLKDNMRELFIIEYSKLKGWDAEDLNIEQLSEIKSQQNYKNPKMICS